MGVKAIDLTEDDAVVSMIVCKEEKDVLTITEKGYGKEQTLVNIRFKTETEKE